MTHQPEIEPTAYLLELVRGGDEAARERLVARYLPILKRWAHGRLPARARAMADTEDLVQVSLVRALNKLETFEPKREGAFLAYLRRTLLNAIRDEIRRPANRLEDEANEDDHPARQRSLLEETIGREVVEAFETALSRLPAVQQEAVILRLEFGFTHQEVAEAIGSPSADSARMMVSRALVQLAEKMRDHRPT